MSSFRRAALLSFLIACGGGGGDDGGDDNPDGSTDGGAVDSVDDSPDVQVCPDPDNCPWIEEHLRDVVGKLSGERPVSATVTITRRA